MVVTLTLAGLWGAGVVQDLKKRELSLVVLVLVTVLSLLGQPWPWWVLSGLVLVWPWREWAWCLGPPAVFVGIVVGDPAPGLALALGVTAWANSWWGGADGILLLALALRHGLAGVIVGAVSLVVIGLALMVFRRRSAWSLLATLPDFLARRPLVDGEIPAETEMPAAAALAVAGLAMEVITLWQMYG
jgi:Flp pilus assembly protein protease CpaA